MPETKLEPTLEIDLKGNPGVVRFETLEQVEAFIQAEQNAWNLLVNTARQFTSIGPYPDIVQPQTAALNSMRQKIGQLRSAHGGAESIPSAQLEGVLSPFANRTCIHSKSIIGRTILDRPGIPPEEAIAILLAAPNAMNLQMQTNARPAKFSPLVRGIVEWKLIEAGLNDTTGEWQKKLEEISGDAEKLVAKQQEALGQFNGEAAGQLNQAIKKLEHLSGVLADKIDEAKQVAASAEESFEELKAKHEAEMNAIETAFRDGMKLRAPRDYWAAKKKTHTILAWIWGPLFAAGSVTSLALLYEYSERVVQFVRVPASELPGLEWLFVGVPALIILWGLRLLYQQLTVNLSLMNDAKERVTMVETYLALQAEGKIDPVERPFVLHPLFRPSDAKGDDGIPRGLLDRATEVLSRIK